MGKVIWKGALMKKFYSLFENWINIHRGEFIVGAGGTTGVSLVARSHTGIKQETLS